MKNELPQDVARVIPRLVPSLHFLARRRMLLPALLLLFTHRPLAFVVGQGLWLCTPLEMLVPNAHVDAWATLLSHPHGGTILETLLAEVATNGSSIDESVS